MLKQILTPLALILILAAMAVQLLLGATSDSATADEPIHLLSGYATLTEHHIIFDPEHPFLVKALMALPLLWLHPQMPVAAQNLTAEQKQIDYNSYYQANEWGWQLLFNSQHNGYQLLYAARFMSIILTLALAGIIYWWSRQLFGTLPALGVLALFAFDPNILAHGHLINTDIGASLFFVGTLAIFWKFLHDPSYKWMIATGVMLGLGMLTKFSLGMLAIILPLITLAWLAKHRHNPLTISPPLFNSLGRISQLQDAKLIWAKYTAIIGSIGMIALAIIWLGYGTLMAINPSENPWHRPEIKEPGNTALSILPPTYAKGIANIVAPDRQGYLLGQCFQGSRWDYFPLLSIFKTPLGTLALISASLCIIIYQMLRKSNKRQPSFSVYFFAIPIIIYLSISGLTGINIGIRHILPIYILLLASSGYMLHYLEKQGPIATIAKPIPGHLIAAILILAVIASSLIAAPFYLPYYNALAQEPRPIPFIADDSNTDWGQGTKALAAYVETHNIESLAFDNFISRAEADYLQLPYTSADPSNHNYKGYLAISRSTITNHICQHNNDWGWVVDHHQPVAIIANSINLYLLK